MKSLSKDDYLISKGHAWCVLLLLFFLMAFDFIDRQVLAAVLPYIKKDWALSDTQLGLLVSAVNIAIAALAFPTALIADKWSRTKSMSAMAVTWSLATAACALASNFYHLLAARLMIGAGEAGYTSSGNALLAASFPKRLRATAIGIFNAASMLGTILGVLLGGFIAARWGWRHAFGLVAVPGLLLAAIVYFVKDYKSVVMEVLDKDSQMFRKVRWTDILRKFVGSPTILLLVMSQAAQLMFAATMANWLPSFFNRTYGLDIAQSGVRTAAVMLMAALGIVVSGFIVDKLSRTREEWRLLGPAVSALLTAVLCFAAFRSAPGAQQGLLLFGGAFFMLGVMGPITAAVQELVHPGMRASALGALATTTNLFGMALGPLIAGMLSDHFDLTTALAILSCMPLVSMVGYLLGSRSYAREAAQNAHATVTA
ncbi:MAG TPA: MFS transporter [Burkholderiaceae bacterium]|jgi:MFS family permease